MISYGRKIDALGGTATSSHAYDAAYNDGHTAAIHAATEIGEDADAMISELIETIEDALRGVPLWQWATDAETLLMRIRSRQS